MQFSKYVENDITEQDYTRVCVNGAFVCVLGGGGGKCVKIVLVTVIYVLLKSCMDFMYGVWILVTSPLCTYVVVV